MRLLHSTLFLLAITSSAASVAQPPAPTPDEEIRTLSAAELGPYRPEATPDVEKVRELIVSKTNGFRKKHEGSPLSRNAKLDAAAQDFAQYMARTDRYGHHADGREPAERVEAHKYDLCIIAENIAYQFATTGFATEELAEGAVQGWINSPGHRENMLRPHVTEMGAGVAQSEKTGVFYLVQLFGRPKSEAIEFKIANQSEAEIRYRLGEEAFALPPRYTRTHQMCVPSELTLLEGEKEFRSISPRNGDSYVVEEQNGGMSLRTE
jgi:uncharacterized protein YkwD